MKQATRGNHCEWALMEEEIEYIDDSEWEAEFIGLLIDDIQEKVNCNRNEALMIASRAIRKELDRFRQQPNEEENEE